MPWSDIVNDKDIIFVITQKVMDEVDIHKDGPRLRLRNRARVINRYLIGYLDKQPTSKLNVFFVLIRPKLVLNVGISTNLPMMNTSYTLPLNMIQKITENFGFGHFKQFLIVHQKTPEPPEKCRKAPESVVYFKRVFIPLRQELPLQALSPFYHARKYRTISVPQRQVPRAFRPTRPRKAFCRDL